MFGVFLPGTAENTSNIMQEDLEWQILKINYDGSMDVIGTPTSASLYLGGATGYNNGVYVMHDICENLYSKKSEGITYMRFMFGVCDTENRGSSMFYSRAVNYSYNCSLRPIVTLGAQVQIEE